jgi:hypothetical protein
MKIDRINSPADPLPPEKLRDTRNPKVLFAHDFGLIQNGGEELRLLVLEAHLSNVRGDIKYFLSSGLKYIFDLDGPRTIDEELKFIRLIIKTDLEKVTYEQLRKASREAWNGSGMDYYTQIHGLSRKWPYVEYLNLI